MEPGLTLDTPAFDNGQWIGREYTCDGEDRPPELEWTHVPEGTRSFALIMEDPDAPNGTFTHWVVYDIPAHQRRVGGAAMAGTAGRNDFQVVGYGGPCPPANHGAHRYIFRLYALDVESLGLDPGAERHQVEAAIADHMVAETEIMGRFQR